MPTKKNIIDYIIDYEMGDLDDMQTLSLFSNLIKTGKAWKLQGHYGRTAQSLINDEWILSDGTINDGKLEEVLDY